MTRDILVHPLPPETIGETVATPPQAPLEGHVLLDGLLLHIICTQKNVI